MVNTFPERGAVDIVEVSHGFRTPSGAPLEVLDGVSFSAAPGEFLALVGPSGCGKSTLLRLASGLDRPLFGSVYIDGRSVAEPDPRRGLVFQDPTLLPWKTVRQNVALGPQARGRLQQEQEAVDDALELVGLADFADVWPAQLSGGMAQRAALARALVNRPEVLLFDEPLGKLDALTRRTMQSELLALWESQRFTALLVTHDVDEAIHLADRVLVFSPRPARIRLEVNVDIPRPRARDRPEFTELRQRILAVLDADESGVATNGTAEPTAAGEAQRVADQLPADGRPLAVERQPWKGPRV